MPVEIRELIVRTEVEQPREQPAKNGQHQEENACQSEQPSTTEIITQVMDNLKRQKER